MFHIAIVWCVTIHVSSVDVIRWQPVHSSLFSRKERKFDHPRSCCVGVKNTWIFAFHNRLFLGDRTLEFFV
jgi:hypothetical protein